MGISSALYIVMDVSNLEPFEMSISVVHSTSLTISHTCLLCTSLSGIATKLLCVIVSELSHEL